jgi:DNA-binding SARP family transcriptional activator
VGAVEVGYSDGVIAPAGPVELSMLGGFELRCGSTTFRLSHAAERLLAFLAIQTRPLLRVYVAGMLWPDASESHAIGSLRSTLWRLGRSGHRLVAADAEHLKLAPGVLVDLHEVSQRARRLLRGGSAEEGDFGAMVPEADLLPDHYDEWVLLERERFRQLRMHALEVLCSQLSSGGRHGEAVEAGLAAVGGEPLRESAHRALICAHLAEGNRCEAIRQYDRYRNLLKSELGLQPSPSIRDLVTELLAPSLTVA